MKSVSFAASVFAASVFAAAAVCSGAFATTVDIQFTGVGPGQAVNIISPGHNGGVFAGVIQISATNSSNISAFNNGNYNVFCADLYQYANGGVNQYSVVTLDLIPTSAPMGAGAAAAINDLYVFANGAQYVNADYATAFQLAIWEIVSDFGFGLDLNTGLVQASSYNGNVASIVAALFGAVGGNASANLVGVANNSYQDYIVEDAGNVPSPGVLALIGLSGMVGSRRRRA